MSKRARETAPFLRASGKQFEAYGEYSYAYLHDRQVTAGPPGERVRPAARLLRCRR